MVVESFVIVHNVVWTPNSHRIINEFDAHGKYSFIHPSRTHAFSSHYVSSFVNT